MKDKKFCSAVILGAGKGERFGGARPKQFMPISGKPMLYHSLKAFSDSDIIDEIILVTSEQWIDYCNEEIIRRYGINKVEAVVEGGEERYDSVKEGLMSCNIESDYVFIHDGARPYIDEDIIKRGFETAEKYGNAVAAIPSVDTVKIADEKGVVLKTPNRDSVWRIQTPQIFRYDIIVNAYLTMTEEDKKGLTDDAMLIERKTDEKIRLYMGSEKNIKITTENDIKNI